MTVGHVLWPDDRFCDRGAFPMSIGSQDMACPSIIGHVLRSQSTSYDHGAPSVIVGQVLRSHDHGTCRYDHRFDL